MSEPSTIPVKMQCFHCGDECDTQKYRFDGHNFCCNGCKTVYEILGDSSLTNYYKIEDVPGLKPVKAIGDFDFLELPEVRAKIIKFQDDSIYKLNLSIPQIHCSSCIYLLEQLNKLHQDIISTEVNFQRRDLTLTVNKTNHIFKEVFHLLNTLGYTPKIPNEEDKVINTNSKSLIIKIGIAGFCFGNIMLLSFPEYISGESIISDTFKEVFKYLILLLIIPVLFYAAKDYYVSAFKSIKHKHLSVDVPIVLGISALTVRSLYEMFYLSNPGYFDSLAGFIFFLLIGKWFQSRTYSNLSFNKDYKSFFPLVVQKKNHSTFETTRVSEVKKGDLIKLRNQEILPFNAKLMEGNAVFDYSFVTGESKTIHKQKDELLYAGGKLKSAAAVFEVIKEVDNDYLKDLWKANKNTDTTSKTVSLIDKVSQKFTLTIIVIALLGFIYWAFTSNLSKALEVFTSILIVACPCALALAAPFTYSNASQILSKINVYLKDTIIIEKLSTINTLVFDKTGTLTQKENTNVEYFGRTLKPEELLQLKSILDCSLHPLSQILVKNIAVNDKLLPLDAYQEFNGKGIDASLNGNQFLIGSRHWINEMTSESKNTVSSNRSSVFIAINTVTVGYYEFGNVYRPKVLENINALKDKYNVSILSGDGNYEAQFLTNKLGTNVELLFNKEPSEKFQYISEKKIKDHSTIMMLGDGVNDASALSVSDIGIAITDDMGNFTPNSDIIMNGNSLPMLADILSFGKDCKNSLYICLIISLLYNLIGLGFAFSGLLSPFIAAILMPLSSITVVILAVTLTSYFANKRNLSL